VRDRLGLVVTATCNNVIVRDNHNPYLNSAISAIKPRSYPTSQKTTRMLIIVDSSRCVCVFCCSGERPYKCNICGNRFTTKGNLKVHFQRHLEQYPNARMNPDPVPEYLDHQRPVHHPTALPSSSMSNVYDPQQFQPLIGGQSTLSMAPGLTQSTQSYIQQQLTAQHDKAAAASTGTQARQPFHQDSLTTPISVKQETMASTSSGYDKIDVKSQLSTAVISSGTTPEIHHSHHHPQPSPLSALSSMSSALATSFPQHHMLRGSVGGVFPTTIPLPANVPPSMVQMASVPSLNSPSVATAFSSQFRSQASAAGTAAANGTGCLPLPSLKPDLDDDDALEQYMEIQQTDTSKIEELVREATAAAAASGGEGKTSDGGVTSDPNECILCHRVLSCRSALQMHYRTHTGERPYRCRLCGRTFTTKGNLKTHMTVHRARSSGFSGSSLMGGATGHRCPVCRRDFTGSLALQQHIRAAHSTPPCGAMTSSGANPSAIGAPVGLQTMAGGNMQTAGAMTMPFPGQMPNHPGGPNAAAMAAAMMMMPGLNPLLPFINFPFYPTGALGGPSIHPHGAQMFVRPSAGIQTANRPQLQQQTMDGRGDIAELDLRKRTGSDGVGKEKRQKTDVDDDVVDDDVDDDGEQYEYERRSGGNKRTKLDQDLSHTAANLSTKDRRSGGNLTTVERGGYSGETLTPFSRDDRSAMSDGDGERNSDDDDDDSVPDTVSDDRRVTMNHDEGHRSEVHGFDYRTSRSRTVEGDDEYVNGRDKMAERDKRSVDEGRVVENASTLTGSYTSPLIALEERLNAITRHVSQQPPDDQKMGSIGTGYNLQETRRDYNSDNWESGAENQDSDNDDADDNVDEEDFSSGNDARRRQYVDKDDDDNTGNNMSYQDHLDGRAPIRESQMSYCSDADVKLGKERNCQLSVAVSDTRYPVGDQPTKSNTNDVDLYENALSRQQRDFREGSDIYGSSESRGSCSPSSPGGASGDAVMNSGGSSIASNSSSGFGATPPDSTLRRQQHQQVGGGATPSRSSLSDFNQSHQHHQARQQQHISSGTSTSASSTSPSAARFVCSVCSKPFASASALEIHSRTHSGDRPFVCQVCSKAFTTKGNLKVHMGTHAWNRCPSRRGRRMSVVDPATAAVAAAAVVASSATSVSAMNASGINVPTTMPPSAAEFFAVAAAAAAASNPFARFVADAPGVTRSMSVFGYAPPMVTAGGTTSSLVGSSAPAGGFFPDVHHHLARFGLGPGLGSTPGLGDGEKSMQWMLGTSRDERNNNHSISNNNGGNRKPPLAPSTGGLPNGFSAASFNPSGFSPRGSGSGCGELDLSVGRSSQLVGSSGYVSTSVGKTSTTSLSSVSTSSKDFTMSETTTAMRSHRPVVTGPSGTNSVITGGTWTPGTATPGDHRGTTSLTAVMSNCG